MQSSLALVLALVCAAFGAIVKRDVIPGTEFDPEAFKNSCPGQCFSQDKYREWIRGIKPKVEAWYANVQATQQANIPDIPEERWNTLCTEVDTLKTCVNNCNEPADAQRKTKVTEVLDAFKDLACDTSIRGKASCLKQFAGIPSPSCNTQCQSHIDEVKQHALDIHGSRTADPRAPPNFEKAKEAGKAACNLVKCRLTCRKPEIIEKCGDDGFEAAKTTVRKLANLLQVTHRQFRPAENFPDECKPDSILQGA